MTALVANASPIIALARIGQLNLLEAIAGAVVVPGAVAPEILAGPPDDPARLAMEAGWGARGEPRAVPEVLLEWGLGRGETAVLALALEQPGSIAAIDDAEARQCARALGVQCVGTLGVILRAAMAGSVPAAAPLLRALQGAGLYLDASVVRDALARTTGEPWPET